MENQGALLTVAIINIIIAVLNLIVVGVGIIGIPYLIAKGRIKPVINPIEHLKFEIMSEMYKSRSQGKIYCHICKIRDTIFQNENPHKNKPPTLKYLIQFDQALAELDMEKRIFMVDRIDIEMVEYGKLEDKKTSESYQSPYSNTIRQYGIVEESHSAYAIIPTNDLCERIREKRALLRNPFPG